MSNCKQAVDCSPCQEGAPVPQPILPRCQDVILKDGSYTNATVVVENGCIKEITQGNAPLYTPDPCCAPVGGSGGGGGLQGPRGPEGRAATVSIGEVTSIAPNQPATVTNTGTASNVVLNFALPRGRDGEAAAMPHGVTGDFGGWVIENGMLQMLPIDFPPIMQARVSNQAPAGVAITLEKTEDGTLEVGVDLSAYDDALRADIQSLFDQMENEIDQLKSQVTALCSGQPCP